MGFGNLEVDLKNVSSNHYDGQGWGKFELDKQLCKVNEKAMAGLQGEV
jgi:hypothetical protein